VTDSRRNLIGWLTFSCLHVFNAFFHRMWADELQAWGLVTGSDGLLDLHMKLNIDGHPALWYLALWPLKYITSDPVTLQIVSGMATIAVLGLLWMRSPFDPLEKLLLSLSFQLGYNISVVCRSYMLATLLVFLFLALLPHYRKHPWLAWSFLALLANVHVYCVPLSYCLALSLLHFAPPEQRPIRGFPIYLLGIVYCSATVGLSWHWVVRSYLVILILPALTIGLVLWLTSYRAFPARARTWLGPLLGWIGLTLLFLVFVYVGEFAFRGSKSWLTPLSVLGRGTLPVVNPFQGDYWHLALPDIVGTFLFITASVVVALYFRAYPFILSLLGLQATFMAVVYYYLLPGQLWHTSVLFVAILGFVWMGRHYHLLLGQSWILLLIFLPQAVVGANAMIRSKFVPISNCYATAQWIQEQDIDTDQLMGSTPFPALGVAVYLQEPLYFPEVRKRVSYSNWRSFLKPTKAAKRISKRMKKRNLTRAYLVTSKPKRILEALNDSKKLRATEVFRSSGALRGEFSVLELERITQTSDLEP
jgi:hypothetical protein